MTHVLTVTLSLFACSDPPASAAPETIPEVEPAPAPAPAPAQASAAKAPSAPVADALSAVPATIRALYALSLSADRAELTLDPAKQPTRREARSAGFQAVDSAKGGKIITLDGGPFDKGEWRRGTLEGLVSDEGNRADLVAAGYALDAERDLLVVTGESDPSPTIFAFSESAGKLGVVGICSDVTVLDFSKPTPKKAVRKPVIYVYPEKTTKVRVDVALEGEFIARYPAMSDDGWHVTAAPDGLLTDLEGREHRYLFWEGVGAHFDIEPADTFSVPREETVPFLHDVCARNALTDIECGDFITYWLPALNAHPYNLIAFPEAQYEDYAQLVVEPMPDTVIRQFMVFRGVDRPVKVGNPELPQRERSGFTVVEWGGMEL